MALDCGGLIGSATTVDSTMAAETRAAEVAGHGRAVRARIGLGATLADRGYDLPRGELRMVLGRSGYVALVRLEDGRLNVDAALDASAVRDSSPGEAIEEVLGEAGQPPLKGMPALGWRGASAEPRTALTAPAGRVIGLLTHDGAAEPFTGSGTRDTLDCGVAAARLVGAALRDPGVDVASAWSGGGPAAPALGRPLTRVLEWALRRPRVAKAAVWTLGIVPDVGRPVVRASRRRSGASGRRRPSGGNGRLPTR